MKLIVVHFHLRPGGIRRVIELAVPALVRTLQPRIEEVWLVSGEAADATWNASFRSSLGGVPLREFYDPAFGYFSEQAGSPQQRRTAVWKAIDRWLESLTGAAIVWAHNASVARNVTFGRALAARCSARGWSLLFHQHDWWFDNRWARWSEMKQLGILRTDEAAAAIFPVGENVRHLAINQADAAILKLHLSSAAAWLPNPIADSPPVAPERIDAARNWLHARTDGAPVWILPCRLLRRKNVAEALLITRLLRPEACLVTTGGASSQAERPYAERLQAAANEAGWPVRLSVLAGDEAQRPSVEELVAASEVVLLTSLQEGFGLPYLEAALARRPLIARRLPNIAPDLESFGLHFPQCYDELIIPPMLFDWSSERARQRQLFAHWKATMPLEIRTWPEKTPLLEAGLDDETPLAFSRLTLTAQLEVLRHDRETLWRQCAPLNSFLEPWRTAAVNGELALATGCEKAREILATTRYVERFATALAQPGAATCSTAVAERLQADFMRARLHAANLYPLLWSSEI